MSVFLERNHLVLRNPNGSDGNVKAMAQAGFGVILCNVRDYPAEQWQTIRDRAAAAGVSCGPWGRTATGDDWDEAMLQELVRVADEWDSPLCVDSEKELDYSGDDLTRHIAQVCGDRDYAMSVEAWPFASVDWSPLADRPFLIQIFPAESGPASDPDGCRLAWYATGVRCVLFTVGAYAGQTPDLYDLLSPFGAYTADDMSGRYADWSPQGSHQPCQTEPQPAVDWWTVPYPRNPSPPAVQQPRWLYPPDVTGGYDHSPDGPDVQAYKIAVQRLGRWPAPSGSFDQDYSNRFAHGEDNTVQKSGVAGIQRQAGLDDTGNLGAKVFQILRTSLIPQGLPHAGEPAFNKTAVDLLNGKKWWQYPYEQGPGPKIEFPRPLYAPDWPGQPDPRDGPDVQAIKRAVSMLGRWPWQQFSTRYTNEFAHGSSGNVGDTGVAGVQRQTPGLDDTGNVSAKLFELLRRALVPPCLPHPHEPAFDAYSLELLHQALDNQPGQSTREQALATAITQLGYSESPAGSNQNKYGGWYGMNGQPWCAMFVTWCFETGTAGGSGSFAKGSYYAYVPYVVSDARANRRGLSVTSSPIPGDLVCYDWAGDGTYDHIGIFKSGDASSFHAVEGNTSTSNQSNGGQVMDRSRSRHDAAGITFVRVAE